MSNTGNMGFLPPGLRMKKIVREPEWIDNVARARPDGPIWRIKVAYMAYRSFRDAVGEAAELRARATHTTDPEKLEEIEMTALMPLFEKVALDWEFATLENVNSVLRSEAVIRPEEESPEAMAAFIDKYITKQEPIPFTLGFFAKVWVNSYPDRFQNRIFGKLGGWADDLTKEAAKGKAD